MGVFTERVKANGTWFSDLPKKKFHIGQAVTLKLGDTWGSLVDPDTGKPPVHYPEVFKEYRIQGFTWVPEWNAWFYNLEGFPKEADYHEDIFNPA